MKHFLLKLKEVQLNTDLDQTPARAELEFQEGVWLTGVWLTGVWLTGVWLTGVLLIRV